MYSKPKSNQNSDEQLEIDDFWQLFFKDDYVACLDLIENSKFLKNNPHFKAKVLLRSGDYVQAYQVLENIKDSALKDFVYFLLTANPLLLLQAKYQDEELELYQAQTIFLTRLFLGKSFLEENQIDLDPDELIEKSFEKYIAKGDLIKAILASIQSIDIVLEEQLFSKDIQVPIILEQLNNLASLADKAGSNSTKAKLLLLKARLTKNKELVQDAEILFGKDQNKYGLAEVYFTYAKEFAETQYYDKAKLLFSEAGSLIAVGYVNEAQASHLLHQGEIQEAMEYFKQSKDFLRNAGCFEKYGLIIQEISLNAIAGKYQKVKEAVHDLIQADTPSYFAAQAYQILANTVLQLGESHSLAQGHIKTSIDIFTELNRYPQLLNALNFLFQSYLLESKTDEAIVLCNQIIHLAARLGDDELKASKYMDLAYLLVLQSDKDNNEELIEQVKDNFYKALEIFKASDNYSGEAEAYQTIANIYASIGRLEDALENFIEAKKIFKAQGLYLQAAITDVLIGILLLSYVVLNDHSYLLTMKHFDQALLYFAKENLVDLHWKTLFYIADLNHKYYFVIKDKENSTIYKQKAMKYYEDMYFVIDELESQANSFNIQSHEQFGITIDNALDKAYQFFVSIGEDTRASKFRKHLN